MQLMVLIQLLLMHPRNPWKKEHGCVILFVAEHRNMETKRLRAASCFMLQAQCLFQMRHHVFSFI